MHLSHPAYLSYKNSSPLLIRTLLPISVLIFGFIFFGSLFAQDNIPVNSRTASQMKRAASTFMRSLSQDQRKALTYPFTDDKARTGWHNAPVSSVPRKGLPLARFSIEQRKLLHELLIASTSSQGYHKIWAATRFDDELNYEGRNREITNAKDVIKNMSIGVSNYYISFHGNPQKDSRWGWVFTGHHLGANFTVIDDKMTFLPLFYGSDPDVIDRAGHAGHRALPQERRRAFELLNSLNPKQKTLAVLGKTFKKDRPGSPLDFKGAGQKDVPTSKRGIRGDQLSDQQKKLLTILIEEYVRNADFDIAEAKMDEIRRDGWHDIYFMWMGPTDGSSRVFYRVSSPSILIDFVDQRTIFDWNTHPHVIIRDPKNDYGENWLQRHISEDHSK